MFCKNCGNAVADNAAVCVKCGVATDNFKNARGDVSEGVLVAGYILAFLMPLIGGIIGIYALVKEKPGHGIGMLVLALISFLFWLAVLGAV